MTNVLRVVAQDVGVPPHRQESELRIDRLSWADADVLAQSV